MKNAFIRDTSADRMSDCTSKARDNSESLERIHTFSLKNSLPKQKTEAESGGSNSRNESKHSNGNVRSTERTQKQMQEPLILGEKTYYIEESVKIIGNIIAKADPILTELASKVN